MKSRTTVYALAAMLAVPAFAFAQSATSPGNGTGNPSAAQMPLAPNTAPANAGNSSSSVATYTTVDQMTRASKIIGAAVYDDQNQRVGSVNELLIDNSHGVSGVVLSVGGFLGVNSKLVKVPFQAIHVTGDRLVMSGMSKDRLEQMPDYKIVPDKAS
jgi:sporulation protein YlmC with PRC-barrel domain